MKQTVVDFKYALENAVCTNIQKFFSAFGHQDR